MLPIVINNMETNKKTMFDAIYTVVEQVDGIAISYGSIGTGVEAPLSWVSFNEGKIKLHPNKEAAQNEYRLILAAIMEEMKANRTKEIENELPW